MSLGKSVSLSKFVFWSINKKLKSSQHWCEYPLCSFDAPLSFLWSVFTQFLLAILRLSNFSLFKCEKACHFFHFVFLFTFLTPPNLLAIAVWPVLCTSEIRVDVSPMGENSLLNEYVAAFLDWRLSFKVQYAFLCHNSKFHVKVHLKIELVLR